MFDFYQVERIELRLFPYKFETTSSVTGVNPVNARPIYSCLDPESTGPSTADEIASYGNLHVTPAYATHVRTFTYHQLGMQKQNRLILKTNGSAGSREQYSDAA